jgi:hypothetical protein
MYCSQCGKELPDNAKFCQQCSSPVSGASAVQSKKGININGLISKLKTKRGITYGVIALCLLVVVLIIVGRSPNEKEKPIGEKIALDFERQLLLFADRFPFVYLTNDYNIDVFAAFVGCSAETEASFETIAFLSTKVDELNLQYLIVLENSSDKIANTIIKNSKNKNQEILILNSIQSCTQKQIAEGLTYFDVMSKNLDVLKKALM